MEGEIRSLIIVWMTVFACLTYCHFISSKIPKGKIRLLSIIPIIAIFILLPLNLNSISFGGTTGFFIAWLANFKLLLFAFGQPPLSSDTSASLLHFISIACLPIMIKQGPPPNIQNSGTPSSQITKNGPKSTINYATKCLILALFIHIQDYNKHIHPKILLFLYCFDMYLSLEIILAMLAALARFILRFELEPQFNDPHLSTSLQDFWGKRWNLMVTSVLRVTVYEPVRSISTPILGRKWAMAIAVLATFAVSGLMHELIFFYLGRMWPTWEVLCFFVLHGVCLVAEVAVKMALKGRWQLHWLVSRPLAIGFVLVTSFWLFFPQFSRYNIIVREIREVTAVVESLKEMMKY